MGLITYRELSKELSLSVRYLQRCVKEDGLPCIRFGKAVRFDLARVTEWANSQNRGVSSPEKKEAA